MARNLDFSSLKPDRDTFTDLDGKDYDFLGMDDFNAKEIRRLQKLYKVISRSGDRLGSDDDDIDNIDLDNIDDNDAIRFDKAINLFIGTVIPDLPKSRIEEITTGEKLLIIEFYNESLSVDSNQGGEGVITDEEDPTGELEAS